MTTTDRTDADDAEFAALLARVEQQPACDPWRDQIADALRPHRYDSVGMICDCGVECGIVCDGLTREEHLADVIASLKPSPGTDSSGQAVQRVLDQTWVDLVAYEWDREAQRAGCAGWRDLSSGILLHIAARVAATPGEQS